MRIADSELFVMKNPTQLGRYRIDRKIGSGGTSEIFKAYLETEAGFRKAVAIKRLLPGFCENLEVRDLIIDEARILTHLWHNSIVQVLDFGCDDGAPFIVMEYVDGVDCSSLFRRLVANGRPLLPEHALYIIDRVLLALDFAHRCKDDEARPLGIIHRDISPSNILISWAGEVKVVDFGIARGAHRTRLTQAGKIRGKYSYMSPEQARGEVIDGRADLFACAVVLFELATGQRLFDAGNDLEVLEKVRNLDVPWELIDTLPASIRAILFVEFSESVESRFASASEMLMDVRAAERNSGSVISSIEMSEYLLREFGKDGLGDSQRALFSCRERRATTAVIPERGHDVSGKAISILRVCAVILSLMLFMSISSGEKQRLEHANVQPGAVAVAKKAQEVPSVPRRSGAIAVSTEPADAKVRLSVGEKIRTLNTPFAVEDIEIDSGVLCTMKISKDGYRDISEAFMLGEGLSKFVKNIVLEKISNGSLTVQAEPWGIVSVDGYASGGETPLRISSIRPGFYDVVVDFPPQKKRLQKRIPIAEGKSQKCLVSFSTDSFKCR